MELFDIKFIIFDETNRLAGSWPPHSDFVEDLGRLVISILSKCFRVTLKHRACTLKITLGTALAFIKGEIFCGIMTVLSIFFNKKWNPDFF